MMTKQEFLEENRRATRDATRHSLKVVMPAVFFLIGLAICAKPLIEYIDQHDWLDRVVAVKPYWIAGVMGVMLLAFIFAARSVRQPFGVPCPACCQRLIGITARLAVMTGNCGYCGERVVEGFGGPLITKPGSRSDELGTLPDIG